MKIKTAAVLMLTLLMCISSVYLDLSVDITASAAADGQHSFEFLKAVGVLPPDEAYSAKEIVTRGKFIHMAMGLTGINKTDFADAKTAFSDVPSNHKYAVDIEAAYKLGYIMGNGQSEFAPDASIKPEQAIKILCDILGYRDVAIGKGGYPGGYAYAANSLHLYKGTEMTEEDVLTLSDAAVLIANAAETDILIPVTYGSEQKYERRKDNNALTENLNVYKIKGVLSANECSGIYAADPNLPKDAVVINDLQFKTGNTDISDYLGYELIAYYTEEDGERYVKYFEATEKNIVVSCSTDELFIKNGQLYRERNRKNAQKIDVCANTSYIVNGKLTSFVYSDIPDIADGSVKFVSNNGDNEVEVALITSYKIGTVEGVSVSDNKLFIKGETAVELDADANGYIFEIKKNGRVAGLSDLSAEDTLLVAESAGKGRNKKVILASDETLKAFLSAKGEDTITLDETEYDTAAGLADTLKTGNYYKFCMDYFGRIVRAENEQSMVYGYLYAMEKDNFGHVKCKIFSENSHWVILDFDKTIKMNGAPVSAEDAYASLGGSDCKGLIRYRVDSENKVSRIDSPADMTAYSLTSANAASAAEGDVFRKSYTGTTVWRARSGSFEGKFCLADDSIVFVVPDDGEEDDIYAVKPGMLPSDDSYNVVAYDIDEKLNAKVITVDKLPVGSGSSSDFFFVTSKGEANNSKGELVPFVRGYWKGFKTTVHVKLSATLTEADLQNINIGDPVLFAFNSEGNVINFRNCVPDANGYYGRAYYTSHCQAGGIVLQNDAVNQHLVVNSSLSGDYYNTQYSENTDVYIYYASDRYCVKGSVNEIVPGDIIVSRMGYFFSHEIAVLRQ